MADETRIIQLKLVLDADEAVEIQGEIRKDVETIKQGFLDLGAVGKKSLADINEAFKRVNLKSLRDQISKLKSEIADIQRSAEFKLFTAAYPNKEYGPLVEKTNQLTQAQQTLTRTSYAASQATKELNQSFSEEERSISRLGDVAQRVFRSIMGFLVLNVLRSLIMALGEVVDRGDEFREAINRMSISVRTLQRQGFDITVEELADAVGALQEKFTALNETSLRDGVASLFLLGQRLNLTKDQMFNLSEATAVLAQLTGIDYKEAIDRVGRALATGQTRGLTDLVGGITETTIKHEAQRLKLIEVGEALDDTARVQAIYSLVLKESAKLSEDVSLAQETEAGKYKAAEESVQRLKDSIGSKLLPAKRLLLEALVETLTVVDKLITFMVQWAAINSSVVLSSVVTLGYAIDQAFKGNIPSLEEFRDKFNEVQKDMLEYTSSIAEEILDPKGLPDIPVDEQFKKALEDFEEGADDLENAYKDLFAKLREAMIDGQERQAAENRKYWQEFAERVQRFIAKITAENDKYLFDQGKVWRQYYDDLEDLNRKYREKEIAAEEDFQEKIRDLRNKFLMDLEDALQQRDARQVLRLIKDFNKRMQELRRQRDKEKEDLDERRRNEEEELKRRRDRRLRELRLEHQFRLKQMREQEALERKLAEEAHINRMKEMQIQTQQRLEQIVRQFNDEHDITKEGAAAVADALLAYFGPDGQISKIYDYMLAMTDSFNEQWKQRLENIKSGLIGSGLGALIPDSLKGLIPEVGSGNDDGDLNSIPKEISKFGSSGMASSNFMSSANLRSPAVSKAASSVRPATSSGGRASIIIGLQEGLTGEIVDQALGEVADVFIRTAK